MHLRGNDFLSDNSFLSMLEHPPSHISGYEPDSEDLPKNPNIRDPGIKKALRSASFGILSMEAVSERRLGEDVHSSLKDPEPILGSWLAFPPPPPHVISMKPLLPHTSFKSFVKKQQEQAYVHSNAISNANPINFDIKGKMESRRKAHHVHSTTDSSTRFDTDGFWSGFPTE